MSEPLSLYAKITISPDARSAFLEAVPSQPTLDDQWTQWWASRIMHRQMELTASMLRTYAGATNRELLDNWLVDTQAGGFNEYDAHTGIWQLGMLQYAENYLEILPGIAFLRSLSAHRNDALNGDFALIYDHLWGDQTVAVYIDYALPNHLLGAAYQSLTDLPADKLRLADTYLTNKLQTLMARYDD